MESSSSSSLYRYRIAHAAPAVPLAAEPKPGVVEEALGHVEVIAGLLPWLGAGGRFPGSCPWSHQHLLFFPNLILGSSRGASARSGNRRGRRGGSLSGGAATPCRPSSCSSTPLLPLPFGSSCLNFACFLASAPFCSGSSSLNSMHARSGRGSISGLERAAPASGFGPGAAEHSASCGNSRRSDGGARRGAGRRRRSR